MERPPIFPDRPTYYGNGYISESNLQVQCNPHQNHSNRKVSAKIHMEAQKTLNRQSNLTKKVLQYLISTYTTEP
jgi:hypothetical protein